MVFTRPSSSKPVLTLTLIAALVVLIVLNLDVARVYQPLRAQLLHSDAASNGTDSEVEPQRRWWEPPALVRWSTQAEFLLLCSELAPGGIPGNHSSQLAPLLAHPPDETPDYDVYYTEVEAAMAATQAIKSGLAPAEPINCLRDPPHAALPPVGSRPKIAIVVGYSAPKDAAEQDSMYTRSLSDKQEYAAKHGYELVVFGNITLHPDKTTVYLKILGTMMHLRRFDWVWAVDLDTIITNQTIPIETFLDPRYDVVITRDCNGINCGTIFFRNSTWSLMLLAEMYMHNGDGLRDGTGQWPELWRILREQTVLWKYLENDLVRNRVKVVPQRLFNSYPGHDCAAQGTWHEGDFMIHFAGLGKPFFNDYWAKRPRSPSPPPKKRPPASLVSSENASDSQQPNA